MTDDQQLRAGWPVMRNLGAWLFAAFVFAVATLAVRSVGLRSMFGALTVIALIGSIVAGYVERRQVCPSCRRWAHRRATACPHCRGKLTTA